MQLTSAQSSLIVVAIYVGFCLLELIRTRLFAKSEQSRHDGIIEIVSTFTLLIATQPAILLIVGALGHAWFPQYEGALAHAPWYAALALFLVFEDMMNIGGTARRTAPLGSTTCTARTIMPAI